jgi:hypothetical protein
LLLDAGLTRFTDGHNTNHGRDSDRYAQDRQDAAHLVPKERHHGGLKESCVIQNFLLQTAKVARTLTYLAIRRPRAY